MSDSDLVSECLKGKPSAQRTLFQLHSGKMFAVCLRYMGSTMEAEEVLQESFIKVFEKLKQWKGEGPLGGWIRTIVVNTALTRLKNNKKFRLDKNIDEAVALSDNGEDQLEALQAADLMKLIAQMPDGYKTVFNLFVVEGYGHKEIAEVMGISESTSKTQFLKGKNWLVKRINEQ
jgi:RNA polymerase sigma factor (sigma-70 family)